MLLNQLKYFVAVVENNSFTEAASRLYVSQSAVSQQIQVLEETLGVVLLTRQHRRFQLTPAGSHFYQRSKMILAQVDEMAKETITIGTNEEVELKIGYLRVYGGQELQEAITQFSEIYPEITLSVINGTHEELYHEIINDRVDIILSDQRRAFSDECVNFELVKSPMYVEISKRHPLSETNILTLKMLENTPCILIAANEQKAVEEEYYKNTLGFSGHFIFAENLEAGRLLVAANQGFLPIESVGTLAPVTSRVKRIPLYRTEQPIIRNYCAFWMKRTANYYIEEFALILQKLLQKDATL
ncbi:transcriptional regulator [Brochothrix thermosphacta]|uniref:LysR family transcriptional regulator n=1 Tax=Brochothrix thermosphacta TaxID=2756 RepID=UPI000E764FE9|nr:LysR family transcriptional regulator [Brochothrix thermosphacta]ANZ94131.1 transcriptional regulator [Brochothrix thermosphacta]